MGTRALFFGALVFFGCAPLTPAEECARLCLVVAQHDVRCVGGGEFVFRQRCMDTMSCATATVVAGNVEGCIRALQSACWSTLPPVCQEVFR